LIEEWSIFKANFYTFIEIPDFAGFCIKEITLNRASVLPQNINKQLTLKPFY